MIAPSPDWFVSINSLNLRNASNTAWKDSFTIDVFIYDAGTDDGTDYTSANNPNTPTPITKITGYPFFGNKIGTLTVTQKSLSVSSFEEKRNIVQVYPNPTTGKRFYIENSNGQALSQLEVYDLLGKRIKTVSLNRNTKNEINLNEFSSGIYLVKIYSENGTSVTKKLQLQ